MQRTYTGPSQTLPRDRRGRGIPKVIPGSHYYYPNTKTTDNMKRENDRPISLMNIDENYQQ